MMYRALIRFRDREDGHLYDAGEAFPHDGRGIDPARIAELSSDQNNAHTALIEAVPDEGKEMRAEAEKPQKRPRKVAKSMQ